MAVYGINTQTFLRLLIYHQYREAIYQVYNKRIIQDNTGTAIAMPMFAKKKRERSKEIEENYIERYMYFIFPSILAIGVISKFAIFFSNIERNIMLKKWLAQNCSFNSFISFFLPFAYNLCGTLPYKQICNRDIGMCLHPLSLLQMIFRNQYM